MKLCPCPCAQVAFAFTPHHTRPHRVHSSTVVAPWNPHMSAPDSGMPHSPDCSMPGTDHLRFSQVAALSPAARKSGWRGVRIGIAGQAALPLRTLHDLDLVLAASICINQPPAASRQPSSHLNPPKAAPGHQIRCKRQPTHGTEAPYLSSALPSGPSWGRWSGRAQRGGRPAAPPVPGRSPAGWGAPWWPYVD